MKKNKGLSPRRRAYTGLMKALMAVSVVLTCALVLFMIGYVFYRGLPFLS